MAKIGSTNEAGQRKLYVGLGNFKIVAINPTKEERDEIYGRKIDKEVNYLSTDNEGNKRVNVTVYCKCENDGIDLIIPKMFTIVDCKHVSKAGNTEYIDVYGRNKWDSKAPEGYREAYNGEVKLNAFFKTYLCIPNVTKFTDGVPDGLIDNPETAEFAFENIKDWFNGDFSELKEILGLRPNNVFTGLATVRTTDKGQFQDLYDVIASGAFNNGNRIIKDVNKQVDGGWFTDITDFNIIHKYNNQPTNLAAGIAQNNATPDDIKSDPDGDLPF